jgi:hypothetical protein
MKRTLAKEEDKIRADERERIRKEIAVAQKELAVKQEEEELKTKEKQIAELAAVTQEPISEAQISSKAANNILISAEDLVMLGA